MPKFIDVFNEYVEERRKNRSNLDKVKDEFEECIEEEKYTLYGQTKEHDNLKQKLKSNFRKYYKLEKEYYAPKLDFLLEKILDKIKKDDVNKILDLIKENIDPTFGKLKRQVSLKLPEYKGKNIPFDKWIKVLNVKYFQPQEYFMVEKLARMLSKNDLEDVTQAFANYKTELVQPKQYDIKEKVNTNVSKELIKNTNVDETNQNKSKVDSLKQNNLELVDENSNIQIKTNKIYTKVNQEDTKSYEELIEEELNEPFKKLADLRNVKISDVKKEIDDEFNSEIEKQAKILGLETNIVKEIIENSFTKLVNFIKDNSNYQNTLNDKVFDLAYTNFCKLIDLSYEKSDDVNLENIYNASAELNRLARKKYFGCVNAYSIDYKSEFHTEFSELAQEIEFDFVKTYSSVVNPKQSYERYANEAKAVKAMRNFGEKYGLDVQLDKKQFLDSRNVSNLNWNYFDRYRIMFDEVRKKSYKDGIFSFGKYKQSVLNVQFFKELDKDMYKFLKSLYTYADRDDKFKYSESPLESLNEPERIKFLESLFHVNRIVDVKDKNNISYHTINQGDLYHLTHKEKTDMFNEAYQTMNHGINKIKGKKLKLDSMYSFLNSYKEAYKTMTKIHNQNWFNRMLRHPIDYMKENSKLNQIQATLAKVFDRPKELINIHLSNKDNMFYGRKNNELLDEFKRDEGNKFKTYTYEQVLEITNFINEVNKSFKSKLDNSKFDIILRDQTENEYFFNKNELENSNNELNDRINETKNSNIEVNADDLTIDIEMQRFNSSYLEIEEKQSLNLNLKEEIKDINNNNQNNGNVIKEKRNPAYAVEIEGFDTYIEMASLDSSDLEIEEKQSLNLNSKEEIKDINNSNQNNDNVLKENNQDFDAISEDLSTYINPNIEFKTENLNTYIEMEDLNSNNIKTWKKPLNIKKEVFEYANKNSNVDIEMERFNSSYLEIEEKQSLNLNSKEEIKDINNSNQNNDNLLKENNQDFDAISEDITTYINPTVELKTENLNKYIEMEDLNSDKIKTWKKPLNIKKEVFEYTNKNSNIDIEMEIFKSYDGKSIGK